DAVTGFPSRPGSSPTVPFWCRDSWWECGACRKTPSTVRAATTVTGAYPHPAREPDPPRETEYRTMTDLVQLSDIEAAADRIADGVLRTPLLPFDPAPAERPLWIKAESLQPTSA